MGWAQIIFFLITNAPTLIKSIRELIDLFDGDPKVAKEMLKDLNNVKKQAPMSDKSQADMMNEVIQKYFEHGRK